MDGSAVRQEPRPAPQSDRILVPLQSETPDLTFHLRTDQSVSDVSGFLHDARGLARVSGTVTTDTFEELCTAPCTTAVDRGAYVFGLSLEGERPILAEEPAYIDENTVVDGKYESYSTMRTFGWVTVIGSAVVGSARLFSGINDCSRTVPGRRLRNDGHAAPHRGSRHARSRYLLRRPAWAKP